jgi:hypothetical protein
MLQRRAAASAVILLLVSGCNCTQTFNKVQPALQMDDAPLDFGEVAVNSKSLPRTVTLKAITGAAITIAATIEDDAEGVFNIEAPNPKTVPANGKTSISVTFSPKAVKPYAATLVVTSNDPNPSRSVHHISLSGSGESPQIAVDKTSLGLSAVACPAGASSVRCRDEQTVTIKNTGLVNLTLGIVKIVGADASTMPPANLSLKALVSTATILAGDTQPVTIVWRPHGDANVANSQTGDLTARLEIPSDDPANPVIYVTLNAHSDPAEAPHLCLNALQVMQRHYVASTGGAPMATNQPVSTTQWVTPGDATVIHDVLPGMTVTFTTLPFTESAGVRSVDTVTQQHAPCTYDPQGLDLTTTWSLTSQPAKSRSGVAGTSDSGVSSADGVLPIDAAGEYVVTVRVADSLGLFNTASMTLHAPEHDDLLTQASWPDAGEDLDLHLIVDQGPNVTVPGTFLSSQDCYWQKPSPNWFNEGADEQPVLLRDDQGVSGQLETINLITAPINSVYRAVVHHFDGSTSTKPSLDFQSDARTGAIPTITASRGIARNEIWIGAKIEFLNCPANCTTGMCCPPTITALDQFCTFTPDGTSGEFSGTVACPAGGSL